MELKEAIEIRRSIRHYNGQEVSTDEIKEIINGAIKSPSAHNKQPWSFYIIHENKAKKDEIADILLSNTGDYTAQTCNVIKECSALILVFAKIENELMDIESVGAAIENMLLTATDLNIASLWIGYIINIESILQAMFNTSDKLVAAVALGHTDKIPKPRPRKTLEECTLWY